jgi:sec-independent protein translocase protein TatC
VSELRARLVITLAVPVVAFGFAFWQNHVLLNVLNRPLSRASAGALRHSHGPLAKAPVCSRASASRWIVNAPRSSSWRSPQSPLDAAQRRALNSAARADAAVVAVAPTQPPRRQPVTLGLGEPFTQTLTVAGYFAVLFALPVILWQLYAFVIPAFSPGERRVAVPLLAMAPPLFIAGIAFGYFVVLPGAVGSCRTSTPAPSTPSCRPTPITDSSCSRCWQPGCSSRYRSP